MVGTSRCIAATLFKFGGPETLPQAAPPLCARGSDSELLARVYLRTGAGNFPAHNVVRSTKYKVRAKNEKGFLRLREVANGLWAHVQGREVAASFAAAA